MLYVTNDIHGNPNSIQKTVAAINRMRHGDTLIINGDAFGMRGPIMSEIVSLFYNVRRGDSDTANLNQAISKIVGREIEIPKQWIFKTTDSGMFLELLNQYKEIEECATKEADGLLQATLQPLSEAAKDKVKLICLPGNGEIAYLDYMLAREQKENRSTEQAYSFCAQWKKSLYEQYGIRYIENYILHDEIALISTNLLDLETPRAISMLQRHNISKVKTVIVHYPPCYSLIKQTFDFWTLNKPDIRRIIALKKILRAFPQKGVRIIFGHVHLGLDDSRMNSYPNSIDFRYKQNICRWVKPGEILEIS